MRKTVVHTDAAPKAIGTYSQAVRCGSTVYLSGQIPLDPETGALVEGAIEVHIRRVFDNLRALCRAAGGDFDRIAKLNVFLTDLGNFAEVNRVMAEYFQADVRRLEPGLTPGASAVLCIPNHCYVAPCDLTRARASAARATSYSCPGGKRRSSKRCSPWRSAGRGSRWP